MTKLAHGKIVLATGAFDLLHLGHVRFLQASKRRGGPGAKLIVLVARDKTVLNRKRRMPILPEDQRRELVGSLRVVDKAILGHTRLDLLGVLREVKPDIISVGYDQKQIKASVERLLREQDLHVHVVQIPKFGPNGLNSSTGIKQRVAKRWTNQAKPRRVL
ncbi:MAG TPA: adenylyltransferase/cytidyltransferase family protein [Candidatus Angelobacter sp.]|nr:adenylyltransferase/cytidyltransferase family protein [Candidatus Angelobacter sp.]